MKPEQITSLANIEQELVDIFVAECQPKNWPGMEKAGDRGDRYWHKKNALATLQLVGRIQTVLRDARGDGGAAGDGQQPGERREEVDIEAEAAKLAKQGVAMLRQQHEKRRR